jgi:hypothetical protein
MKQPQFTRLDPYGSVPRLNKVTPLVQWIFTMLIESILIIHFTEPPPHMKIQNRLYGEGRCKVDQHPSLYYISYLMQRVSYEFAMLIQYTLLSNTWYGLCIQQICIFQTNIREIVTYRLEEYSKRI